MEKHSTTLTTNKSNRTLESLKRREYIVSGISRTKKKKEKKKWLHHWKICPFCDTERKLTKESKKYSLGWLLGARETKCRNCWAKEVPVCPACKNPTWKNKEGYYKHAGEFGCGFYGKKLKRRVAE